MEPNLKVNWDFIVLDLIEIRFQLYWLLITKSVALTQFVADFLSLRFF
jgi:hypothetical protein